MRVRWIVRLACGACALFLTMAGTASAEIVYLTSGRTLSVKDHRIDGDAIILSLRGGGEVTFSRSLVDKVVPDEVPHPDPEDVQAAGTPADPQSLLKSTPYGDIIASVSEAQGVNPLLVRAVIEVESNYRPRARSRKGAMGLMQLMPATARAYRVRKPFDPKANIEAGVRHLKTLIDRWGVELALAAYNAGEGAVERFKGIPPYRETRSYVSRILSLAKLR